MNRKRLWNQKNPVSDLVHLEVFLYLFLSKCFCSAYDKPQNSLIFSGKINILDTGNTFYLQIIRSYLNINICINNTVLVSK